MRILIPSALCVALVLGTGMASAAGMSNHGHRGMSPQQASVSNDTSDSQWTRSSDNGSPTTALNLLQENGYTDFSNFHKSSNGKYEATVQDHGQTRNVVIDPSTNSVQPES